MSARVGLVIVSHSALLAEGVVELAAQMAPDVIAVAAGGANGGLGTDFDVVSAALGTAQAGAGVVVLYDLGSAKMVADMAVEMLDEPGEALVVDASLVEGAVAAAVAAQGNADLAGVAAAATGDEPSVTTVDGQHIEVLLTNDVGLHARPAAMLARELTGVDATVTVRFGQSTADARSVLALLGLGATGGDTVQVSASGPDAEEALRKIRALAGRNFDE